MTRILNLGHRGAPERAPENTIPAFLKAMEAGADGVELDVRLSRDGAVVVMHNCTVDKTTDGRGRVSERTLAELKTLDSGSWFSPDFTGTRIPTLEEVLEILPKDAYINIETKSRAVTGALLEQKVAALIECHRLYDRAIVSSFNPFSLIRIKRMNRRIPVGMLYLPVVPVLPRFNLINLIKPEALHPYYKKVSAAYMTQARARGYRVNVWTVNTSADMEKMLDLRVDGIITNRPEILHRLLRERD